MIVDTSALAAILLAEDDAGSFEEIILGAAQPVRISAGSVFELLVVALRKKGAAGMAEAEALIAALDLRIEPVGADDVALARDGYERYAKGRYGLNFGDGFAYALAKAKNLPLLFKGDDFRTTDVKSVL